MKLLMTHVQHPFILSVQLLWVVLGDCHGNLLRF
jgi:hypothetical protein